MKWKPLRIAAILYVLTALSATVVSGTFAKYTTEATSSDSARVAKWGISILAEGNLFGENYDGTPSNSITENADGSITVKSCHKATLGNGTETGNVVAPGTENKEGLVFGLSGTAETALKVDITITNQSIALRPNIFYILHKVKDTVTEQNFPTILARYETLYKATGEAWVPANEFTADTTYYYTDNATDLLDKGFWPYCPVVYEINPTDGSNGLKVTRTSDNATSTLMSATDKSIDIISWLLKYFSLNNGTIWPSIDPDDSTYTRTCQMTFGPGKDLSTLGYNYNSGTRVGMVSERLTWAWDYRQPANTELYDRADNILGRLAFEKINGLLDDDYVVIADRTYWIDTNGQYNFSQKENGTLIRPTEYVDYCLETMFSIEMTITQID